MRRYEDRHGSCRPEASFFIASARGMPRFVSSIPKNKDVKQEPDTKMHNSCVSRLSIMKLKLQSEAE